MATTITVSERIKHRLDHYRHRDHESWDGVLDDLMGMVPAIADIQEEGCTNCGQTLPDSPPPAQIGGVTQWVHADVGEGEPVQVANYYCSPECAAETAAEMKAYIPEHPDLVVVGGDEELRTEFEGASFYIDGQTMEVGIPVPGAFAGADDGDQEYEYLGEPVYIKNAGKWVQQGVVGEIIHEEAHTSLILGHDYETVMSNHPDGERRGEYLKNHANSDGSNNSYSVDFTNDDNLDTQSGD